MKDLTAVKKKISAIESDYNNLIADYSGKLANAKAREAEAIKAADIAYKNTDIEEYHRAQEEARLSGDAIKMYEEKLAELDKAPFISKDQFNEIHADIINYLGDMVAADKEKLRAIVKDMIAIKDNELTVLGEGNKLLEHVQRDLLKDPCGVFASNGAFVPMPNKVKRFKDYSVSEFLRFVTSHPLAEDLAESEEIKIWGRG